MKPVLKNSLIAIGIIGVIAVTFLILFLPSTKEVKLSGTFVNTQSAEKYEEMTKITCTLDFKVTSNIFGNIKPTAEGIVKIGDREYPLFHMAIMDEKHIYAFSTDGKTDNMSLLDPVVDISFFYDGKTKIYVDEGESKGYWIGVIENEEDYKNYYGI